MASKPADALRSKLKGGDDLKFLDALGKTELGLLDKALADAGRREQAALDDAIERSMAMVPFLLRGAFKKILFP